MLQQETCQGFPLSGAVDYHARAIVSQGGFLSDEIFILIFSARSLEGQEGGITLKSGAKLVGRVAGAMKEK